tara:strand:- start:323 stop:706 length:384 start_codon:yes stop_codon:yes gene_type:complete
LGTASQMQRNDTSHFDPASQSAVVCKGPAFFGHSDNCLIDNDQYVCLDGYAPKQFRRNNSDPKRGLTGKGVPKHRGLKLTCQACPANAFRSIPREQYEDVHHVAFDITRAPKKLAKVIPAPKQMRRP